MSNEIYTERRDEKFDAVVLSGGGSKGILSLGALHYFYTNGRYSYDSVDEYAGTSVGSVICLLLVCGYEPMEIFTEVYSMENFFSTDRGGINVWSILQKKGLLSIDSLVTKIKGLVYKKLGYNPTFRDIYEKRKKRLYICATNLSLTTETKYSMETSPNMLCIQAMAESCSIPLFFESIKNGEYYMSDGGLSNNYPWNYISPEKRNILGIVIGGKSQTATFPEGNVLGYIHKMVMTPIKILTDLRCQSAPSNVKTIHVSWKEASMFSMNSEQKMKMFLNGYNTAETQDRSIHLYVEGWNSSLSKEKEELELRDKSRNSLPYYSNFKMNYNTDDWNDFTEEEWNEGFE